MGRGRQLDSLTRATLSSLFTRLSLCLLGIKSQNCVIGEYWVRIPDLFADISKYW